MTASPGADANPVETAVEKALRETVAAWWQTPPRLDLAADYAVDAHRRAVLDQRDDGEMVQRISDYLDASAFNHLGQPWSRFLLAALADAEIARRQAEADVQRLREQNKASSDEWTKRTATMESRIARTEALFEQARRWVDERSGEPWWAESTYGKYAAVLMMERAEQAEADRDMLVRVRDRAVGKMADYAELSATLTAERDELARLRDEALDRAVDYAQEISRYETMASTARQAIRRVRERGDALLAGELAHRSRDYGRGVAQATKDMLAALDGGKDG